MPYEHNDEKSNDAGKTRQKRCTDLPTMFELLCTIMFLYSFNNVCSDGVIPQWCQDTSSFTIAYLLHRSVHVQLLGAIQCTLGRGLEPKERGREREREREGEGERERERGGEREREGEGGRVKKCENRVTCHRSLLRPVSAVNAVSLMLRQGGGKD